MVQVSAHSGLLGKSQLLNFAFTALVDGNTGGAAPAVLFQVCGIFDARKGQHGGTETKMLSSTL